MAESIHAIYKKGLEKFNNQPVCLKVDGLLNLDDVDNVVLSRGSLEVRLLSDLTQVQTISDYSVQLLDNFWLYSYITKIINSQGVVLSYQLLPQKVVCIEHLDKEKCPYKFEISFVGQEIDEYFSDTSVEQAIRRMAARNLLGCRFSCIISLTTQSLPSVSVPWKPTPHSDTPLASQGIPQQEAKQVNLQPQSVVENSILNEKLDNEFAEDISEVEKYMEEVRNSKPLIAKTPEELEKQYAPSEEEVAKIRERTHKAMDASRDRMEKELQAAIRMDSLESPDYPVTRDTIDTVKPQSDTPDLASFVSEGETDKDPKSINDEQLAEDPFEPVEEE